MRRPDMMRRRRRMLMRAKRGLSMWALMLRRSPFHQHHHLTHYLPMRPTGLLPLLCTCRLTLPSSNPCPPSKWRFRVFERDILVYVMTSTISLHVLTLLRRDSPIFKDLLTAKRGESGGRFNMRRNRP